MSVPATPTRNAAASAFAELVPANVLDKHGFDAVAEASLQQPQPNFAVFTHVESSGVFGLGALKATP